MYHMNNNVNKQKEIDRIIKIVENIARLDAKLESFCKQYSIDLATLKSLTDEHKRIYDEITILRKKVEDNEDRIVNNQLDINKNQWRYGSIIAFISSTITAAVIILLHYLLGI